jgi:hypothetical protein
MIVIARAKKGAEFLYSYGSAHKVPKASARKICDALNRLQYGITEEQVWHVFEVDEYDRAFFYGERQSFRIYRNKIIERSI